MPRAATYVDEHGRKTFVPLENNPEVMAHLVRLLGVSPKLGFYDVYSVDEPELLSFIPRPAHSLIFICPGDVFRAAGREVENSTMPVYDSAGSEPVVWFKQTIGNACGLFALLHCVCNGEAKQYIQEGSDLDKLLKSAIPLKPAPRAELLHDSTVIEAAHQTSAIRGDSVAPRAEEFAPLHFIAFVKDKGRLWELNGGMKGPLDRGALADDEDALSEKALDLGPRAFLKAAKENGVEDLRFSIVALAPSLE